MTDDPSSAKPGLTAAELAVHPTVFADGAFRDQVVVVSGGAGGIGRAELRGTTWSARGVDGAALARGTRCRVDHIDGLTLWLRAE